jgi:hypothetical protein
MNLSEDNQEVDKKKQTACQTLAVRKGRRNRAGSKEDVKQNTKGDAR